MNCVARAAIQTAIEDGVRDFASIYSYVLRWHVGIEEWTPTEKQVQKAVKQYTNWSYFRVKA